MRDTKSGPLMNLALLCTMLLTALAAAHLFLQSSNEIVNFCMIGVSAAAMVLTFRKGWKRAALWTLGLTAALFLLALIFWPWQLIAFVFWVIWVPATLYSVLKLSQGVNGLISERDFYRSECARIAMVDTVTQMRNMHAYLNDAPIYIKIARRYKLSMVVLAVKLVNITVLREKLGDDVYNEMLEEISRAMRSSVRLEDLAYIVNNETGVWCLTMFTHLDAVDIVISRIKEKLNRLKPDETDEVMSKLDFTYGYAALPEMEDATPITLLQQAIDMTEGKA